MLPEIAADALHFLARVDLDKARGVSKWLDALARITAAVLSHSYVIFLMVTYHGLNSVAIHKYFSASFVQTYASLVLCYTTSLIYVTHQFCLVPVNVPSSMLSLRFRPFGFGLGFDTGAGKAKSCCFKFVEWLRI